MGFLARPQEKLASTGGITNFLFLGIRGEGSDSPNLSDTIIVFSYNHFQKSAALLSIPRDLWVPSLQAKINTAFHYGEEASAGAGITLAQAAILEVTGQPVHYTSVIDFALFREVIDLLGGINVINETAFTDTEFPIPGREKALPVSSRYETITFPAGKIPMDGNTALKFVRSRHSQGESGTDYDRGRRQQAVISAIKEKMLSPQFLLDEQKFITLIDLVGSRLKTNLRPDLYPVLAKLALSLQGRPIRNLSLSDQPDENGIVILFNPPTYQYKGEWVLIPKNNNWGALKQYVQNRLSGTQ